VVADGVPLAHRAVASPDQDGSLTVDATDVEIGTSRLGQDYYRRLLTLSGNLIVIDSAPLPSDPGNPVHRQTNLSGEIRVGGVMQPDVSTYFSQHSSAPQTPDSPPDSKHWELNTGGAQYAFFKTSSGGAPYSVISRATIPADPAITVHVSGGIAIWMLDRGMRADDKVTISGGPGSALVIVAGMTTEGGASNAERGFNLLGGLDSTIPLILVTNGIVGIEHKEQALLESSNMPFTSIYARDAYFMGPYSPPENPFAAQNISYHPSVNPILDLLGNLGLLPNSNVVADPRMDLDCDGAMQDADDLAILQAHVGHACGGPTSPHKSSWGRVKVLYR
jgi:hypothetical protein